MTLSRFLAVVSIALALVAAVVLFGWFGIDEAKHASDGFGLVAAALAALAGASLEGRQP
jgi:hypothetical protein